MSLESQSSTFSRREGDAKARNGTIVGPHRLDLSRQMHLALTIWLETRGNGWTTATTKTISARLPMVQPGLAKSAVLISFVADLGTMARKLSALPTVWATPP